MDLFGWLLVLDDSFDQSDLTPTRARNMVDQLIGVLHHPTDSVRHDATATSATSPLLAALADLWTRERQGMSPAWRRRALTNWEDYLRCFITETTNRHNGIIPDTDTYLALRDKSGIMYPLLDSAERIGHCELPDVLRTAPPLQSMRDACVWICNIAQDLLSFDREETNHDPHNLVFVLEHQHGHPRQHIIDQIRSMIEDIPYSSQGRPPAPRAGHATCSVRSRLGRRARSPWALLAGSGQVSSGFLHP